MKKILALIFSVLMIASCFCFSTSAAGTLAMAYSASYSIPDGYTPIGVTYVSHKEVYDGNGTTNTADWTKIWNLFGSYQYALNVANYNSNGTAWEAVGQFDATTVQKIAFRFKYASRVNGITVSLSKDNVTYDEIGVLSASGGEGYASFDIPASYSSTEYKYIKLSRDRTGWLGFNSCVLLKSTNPENAQVQEATYVEGYCANASKIWNLSDFTTVTDKPADSANGAYSIAQLANPTVISKIEFVTGSNGNRARGGKIYGSFDGETWDVIASMPDTMKDYTGYMLPVITNKTYKYVKVTSSTPWEWNWSAVQCRVYGFAETDRRATVVSYESSPAGESANVWLDSNTTVHKGIDDDGISEYTTAKLSAPTVVSDVYISQTTASGRNRQIKILGSVDGQSWTELSSNWRANSTLFNNSTERHEISDTTAYNYIKIDNSTLGDWHWDIANVAVYGEPIYLSPNYAGAQTKVDTQKTVAVTHYGASQTKFSGSAEASAWDTTDKTTFTNYNNSMLNWVSGSFANDTVVTKIIYTTNNITYNDSADEPTDYANRARASYFELSVDGITWVKVGTLPNPVAHDQTYEITVNNTDKFKYIRFSQGSVGGWWTVGTIEVVGYEGGQNYDVRFLATIDERNLENQKIGFKINAKYDGGSQAFDITTNSAYNSVMSGTTPVYPSIFNADDEYFCAVALKNISINKYDVIEFSVQAYAVTEAGKTVCGDTYIVAFKDGKVYDTYISVISANVMADNPNYDSGAAESGYAFSNRANTFFETIENYAPTVVGVQEFCPSWYAAFDNYNFTNDWEILKFKNPNISSEYVFSTIMYRADLYTLVDSGMQFYSKHGNDRCRCYTWAVLKDALGQQFCVVSTHWDGADTENTMQQVAELTAFVNSMDMPVFTTGDFNSNEWSAAFTQYISDIDSYDCRVQSGIEGKRVNNIDSWHGWGVADTEVGGSADHITSTKSDIDIVRFETIADEKQIYASDHAWLYCEFKLK